MQTLVDLIQCRHNPLVTFCYTRHQFRLVDQLHDFTCHCARQRIAAIGGAVGANAHHQRQIFARQHRTNREAAAQRFGAGEHIRRDAIMHVGIKRTGTANAALHFIKNQQSLMLITELTQSTQERRIGRQHAAFTLNGFNNDCAGMVINQFSRRSQIVKRGMLDLWRQRRKIF